MLEALRLTAGRIRIPPLLESAAAAE
jgi:hypothetical protein